MSKVWKHFLLIQGAIAAALTISLVVVGIAIFRQNDRIRDAVNELTEQNRLLRSGCEVR